MFIVFFNEGFLLLRIFMFLVDVEYTQSLGRALEHSNFGVIKDVVTFVEKFKTKKKIVSSSSKLLVHVFF